MKKCLVCLNNDLKIVYDLCNPRIHNEYGLHGIVSKCSTCDLLQKDYDKVNIHSIYSDTYADTFVNLMYNEGASKLKFYNQIVSPFLLEIKKRHKSLNHLDIGSATGYLLEFTLNNGFNPSGVEISEKLIQLSRAKNFNIYDDINKIPENEKFEIVTLMDLIEHLEDPLSDLKKIKNVLSEDGELIVYTPNHDSLVVKIAHFLHKIGIKGPIENIFACSHTFFFTTKTLKSTLISAGYEIKTVKHFKYNTNLTGQDVR